MHAKTANGASDSACVGSDRLSKCILALIGNPDAAARIDVANIDSTGSQLAHEARDALRRGGKRLHAENLRADVHTHAADIEKAFIRCLTRQSERLAHGDAEFVLTHSSRDVRMRLGRDIRIHPQS